MSAKKDRKGSATLHVASITEAMGGGSKIKVGEPNAPTTVRHVMGRHAGGKGPGTEGSAKPFKTIHKGAGWAGPTPRVALPKKYRGKD